MKKCLAPCNQACTPEGAAAYAVEAQAVKRFFDTRGESMLTSIAEQREKASAAMEFERAAELHVQWQKVKAVQALADELVQPIPRLRAVIVQKAAKAAQGEADQSATANSDEPMAALFLVKAGLIFGPARLSTLGVRAVREQTSVGSSLFAQPLMLQAVPLADEGEGVVAPAPTASESPETRAASMIGTLEEQASASPDTAAFSDHLSLLRRWYYRPEKQRTGEIFFPKNDRSWPIRRILNGAARVALGDPKPMADTHRELAERNLADEAQKSTRTKVLHAGRPDVERVVPVPDQAQVRPGFTSRRKCQSSN